MIFYLAIIVINDLINQMKFINQDQVRN